jgi:hypothetical protein
MLRILNFDISKKFLTKKIIFEKMKASVDDREISTFTF